MHLFLRAGVSALGILGTFLGANLLGGQEPYQGPFPELNVKCINQNAIVPGADRPRPCHLRVRGRGCLSQPAHPTTPNTTPGATIRGAHDYGLIDMEIGEPTPPTMAVATHDQGPRQGPSTHYNMFDPNIVCLVPRRVCHRRQCWQVMPTPTPTPTTTSPKPTANFQVTALRHPPTSQDCTPLWSTETAIPTSSAPAIRPTDHAMLLDKQHPPMQHEKLPLPMPFQVLIGIAIFLLGLLLAKIRQNDAADDEHLATVGDDGGDDAVTTNDDEQPAPVVQVVAADEAAAEDETSDMAAAATQQAPVVEDNSANNNGAVDAQLDGSASGPNNSKPNKKTHRGCRGGQKKKKNTLPDTQPDESATWPSDSSSSRCQDDQQSYEGRAPVDTQPSGPATTGPSNASSLRNRDRQQPNEERATLDMQLHGPATEVNDSPSSSRNQKRRDDQRVNQAQAPMDTHSNRSAAAGGNNSSTSRNRDRQQAHNERAPSHTQPSGPAAAGSNSPPSSRHRGGQHPNQAQAPWDWQSNMPAEEPTTPRQRPPRSRPNSTTSDEEREPTTAFDSNSRRNNRINKRR
ncbi:hypothetical protein H4R27_004363 [Coemansia aciculifera]|nr:hypothetical protein H4R27_004363 [Coemansia aciculifera]